MFEKNLVLNFLAVAEKRMKQEALYHKVCGRYEAILWEEWLTQVKYTALGLNYLGVKKGDRVAILSENRPEWTYADLGTLSLGAMNVPIYPTSSQEDIDYILSNAHVEYVFVSNLDHYHKIKNAKHFSQVKKIITFEAKFDDQMTSITISELMEYGRRQMMNNPEHYRSLVDSVDSDDVATVIYTSGTTGPPKGVMLTHANFLYNYDGAKSHISVNENDVSLSFLPLCHVFERLAGYYFMIFSGAKIAYAESMQTVADDMLLVNPTVMAAVPRFYEKIYSRIVEKVDSKLKKKLFAWANQVGADVASCQSWDEVSDVLALKYGVASLILFNKIKKSLGGRLRFFISGGAPLNPSIALFFRNAGIIILEGYGLTETSPVIACNSIADLKIGTVGKPIPNVEVRIAEDGEILTKGPCVMKGYYDNDPATQAAIKDGWFYTGDIGVIDSEGFLMITDRKKDIIKTSGGKMIAPQNLEKELLEDPYILQIIVIGDKRHYLSALIVPNYARLRSDAESLSIHPIDSIDNRSIYEFYRKRIRPKVENKPSYEQIKYFTLLPSELTQTDGFLTPTLKIKRKYVQEHFHAVIDQMYSTNPPTYMSVF